MADYADELAQLDAIKAAKSSPPDYSQELEALNAIRMGRVQNAPVTSQSLSIAAGLPENAPPLYPNLSPATSTESLGEARADMFKQLKPSAQTVQNAADVVSAYGGRLFARGKRLSDEEFNQQLAEPRKPSTGAKVAAGVIAGGINLADTLSTPEGIGLMFAGGIPGALGKVVNAGFLVDMLRQTPQVYQQLGDALGRDDIQAEAEAVVGAIAHGVFTLGTAHGTVKGFDPVKTKAAVEDWIMGTPKAQREQYYNLNPATEKSQTETRNVEAPQQPTPPEPTVSGKSEPVSIPEKVAPVLFDYEQPGEKLPPNEKFPEGIQTPGKRYYRLQETLSPTLAKNSSVLESALTSEGFTVPEAEKTKTVSSAPRKGSLEEQFPVGTKVEYIPSGTINTATAKFSPGEVTGYKRDPVTGDMFAEVRTPSGITDFAGATNDLRKRAAGVEAAARLKPIRRGIPDTRYDDVFTSTPNLTLSSVLEAIKKRDPIYSDLIDKLNKAGVNPTIRMVPMVESLGGQIPNAAGLYSSPSHDIQIRRGVPDVPYYVMHEAVHAATLASIQTNPTFRAALRELYDQAKSTLESKHYGFKDLHEFVAEAFTHPEFQQDLDTLRAGGERVSIWSKLVGLIKRLFGLKDETVLDRVMRLSEEQFSNNIFQGFAEAPSLLRNPEQAKQVFQEKEAEKPGSGSEFIRTQQAAEPIGQAATDTVNSLRSIANTEVPRADRSPQADQQRIERDIAERILGSRIVKSQIGGPVDGLRASSELLAGSVENYNNLKNSTASPELKSRAALDTLHTFDSWDKAKSSFDNSYDRKIKVLEDNLTQIQEGKDWSAYAKSTIDVLVKDVKDIGRSIVKAAGGAGGLKVYEDITSRTGALRNAVAFIANTADFDLIQRGVITTTPDLLTHLSNEVKKSEPGKTMEQAAGANEQTLRYVAQLVMSSEPLRTAVFEAQQFLRDKTLEHPMGEFIKTVSGYASEGKYKEAIGAFTTGVGKTAVEADKARRAAAFFAKQERDTIVSMDALKRTKQLLDALHNKPSVRAVRNQVYSDLNVRAVMQGLSGNEFIMKGINPGDPDTVINFDSSGPTYAANLEKFQKYKEAAAEYLRDPERPGYDPAKAGALKEFLRQYDIYTNPMVSPEAGRLLHNALTAIPRTIFSLVGGIDQIPNVVLRYGAGPAAEFASRTLEALSTAKEVGTAAYYDHRHLMATAVRAALKSHGLKQQHLDQWREQVWTPLVGSRQYFENAPLEVGSPIGNGMNVTREDLAVVKRVRDYERDIIGKLTATSDRSYSSIKNFPQGVVEKVGEGQRIRLPAATGEDTMNRRFGTIFTLVNQWLQAGNDQAKIRLINANIDKLLLGYMMDAGRANFNHRYSFPAEVKAVYNESRAGQPVGSFEDLVSRITDKKNAENEGEPITEEQVSKSILTEFDKLMKQLKVEEGNLIQKTKIRGFGGENSLNTARGQQIAPSTWYDYGSLTDPEHIAYLNTSVGKFYIDHLNAVEALHRSLTELVHKFENAQREQPNVNIHKTSVENRVNGKDYYSWDEAVTAQRQVAGYLDKLNAARNADLAAYEAGSKPTLGETAMDVVVTSLLSGPQANIFNSFGGLFNLNLMDQALRNHAWYYSFSRNFAHATARSMKELGNLVFGNKLAAKMPLAGPLIKEIGNYFQSLRDSYDTGRKDAIITSKDLGKELASMWEFRDTAGSNVQKNPGQGFIGDLIKTGETGVRMVTKALKSATVQFVDSRINMEMGYRQANELARDFENRAKRFGPLRARRAAEEGRNPYDPSDPGNTFTPEEISKVPWLMRGSTDLATQASRVREFMRREVDINLDAKMMDYYKRWSEASDADKPNVEMFTPEERRQLGLAVAAYGNLATFGNRPIAAKLGKVARYASMFLGYPGFQLYKMTATLDRFSKYAMAKGYGKALPLLIGMALTAAVIGSTGVGTTEAVKRVTFNKYGNTPTIFDSHGGSGLPGIVATGAAALFPFYGSIYNMMSGNQFKRGFDINSQFVFLNLATDAAKYLKEVWQTGAIERPTIQFLRRWTFPLNYLGGFIPQVAGLQEITNARNVLSRTAKLSDMEQFLRKSGGGSDINYGPTTPLLNDFMNAVGKGDSAGIDSAFKSIVDYYVKQKGLPLQEATKRALASVTSRNPVSAVFGSKITEGQLNDLYARMGPKEKLMVSRVLGNFDAAINQISGKHISFARAPAVKKTKVAKPPKGPITLGQRALAKASSARGRRSPLSRINRKLGLKSPRVRTVKVSGKRRIRPVSA